MPHILPPSAGLWSVFTRLLSRILPTFRGAVFSSATSKRLPCSGKNSRLPRLDRVAQISIDNFLHGDLPSHSITEHHRNVSHPLLQALTLDEISCRLKKCRNTAPWSYAVPNRVWGPNHWYPSKPSAYCLPPVCSSDTFSRHESMPTSLCSVNQRKAPDFLAIIIPFLLLLLYPDYSMKSWLPEDTTILRLTAFSRLLKRVYALGTTSVTNWSESWPLSRITRPVKIAQF